MYLSRAEPVMFYRYSQENRLIACVRNQPGAESHLWAPVVAVRASAKANIKKRTYRVNMVMNGYMVANVSPKRQELVN